MNDELKSTTIRRILKSALPSTPEVIVPKADAFEYDLTLKPYPFNDPKAHRIRTIWNKILTFVWVFLISLVLYKIFIGVYYFFLEMVPWIRALWHKWVSDPATRHAYRDVGEGYYTSIGSQFWVWNHWRPIGLFGKRSPFRQISQFMSAIEKFLHIPIARDDREATKGSLLLGIILTLVYAVPGFYFGRWVVHITGLEASSIMHITGGLKSQVPPGLSDFWAKESSALASSLPNKLIGLFCGVFFGRRPARGVYDDVQNMLARRRRAAGKEFSAVGRWTFPPGYVARCTEMIEKVSVEQAGIKLTRRFKVIGGTFLLMNLIWLGIGEYVVLYKTTKS